MTMSFPVRFRKAIPTLGVFAVIGILTAAAALIYAAVTEADGSNPWALLGIVLSLPGIWMVIVLCLATFSLRITDDRVQKLLANRWIVVSKPLNGLRSASIVQNTLQLAFRDGTRIRIAAMPLRDRDRLVGVLAARCPHIQLT